MLAFSSLLALTLAVGSTHAERLPEFAEGQTATNHLNLQGRSARFVPTPKKHATPLLDIEHPVGTAPLQDGSGFMYAVTFTDSQCPDSAKDYAIFKGQSFAPQFLGPMGTCYTPGQDDPDNSVKYECNASMVVKITYPSGDSTCTGTPLANTEVLTLVNGTACVDYYNDDDLGGSSEGYYCTPDPVAESGVIATMTNYAMDDYPAGLFVDPTFSCTDFPIDSQYGGWGLFYENCFGQPTDDDGDDGDDDDDYYSDPPYSSAYIDVCKTDNKTVELSYFSSLDCSAKSTLETYFLSRGCVNGAVWSCTASDPPL
jgi:hypothetical protein